MQLNVAEKLIQDHLVSGEMKTGETIGLNIDQTLTQDATGTLVMLELEAMQIDKVSTEVSAQYVDHNLIQDDYRNPDDHNFLRSASNPSKSVSKIFLIRSICERASSILSSYTDLIFSDPCLSVPIFD